MHEFIKQQKRSCFPASVVLFGTTLEVFFHHVPYLLQQIVTEQLVVPTRVVGIRLCFPSGTSVDLR